MFYSKFNICLNGHFIICFYFESILFMENNELYTYEAWVDGSLGSQGQQGLLSKFKIFQATQ